MLNERKINQMDFYYFFFSIANDVREKKNFNLNCLNVIKSY